MPAKPDTRPTSAQVAREVEREIAAVADAIVRRVLSRLAALPRGDEEYAGPNLPLGVSRRVFRMRCAAGLVEGARKEGRSWRCSKAAWHASFAQASRAPVSAANTNVDADDEADAILAASGLRGTR
jgi:hypothetical protein